MAQHQKTRSRSRLNPHRITARSVPNNGGSGAAETQTKKLILQRGPRAELLPAAIDQLWQANPLQKLLPIDWGAITQALSTLSARSMANPFQKPTSYPSVSALTSTVQLRWHASKN